MRRPGTRALVIGTLLIVGGELLCILGPLRYQRAIHLVCHALFYAGVGLAAAGAWRAYRR